MFAGSLIWIIAMIVASPRDAEASVAGAAVLQIPIEAKGLALGGVQAALPPSLAGAMVNPGNVNADQGLSLTFGPSLGSLNRLVPDLADDVTFDHWAFRAAFRIADGIVPSVYAGERRLNYGFSLTPGETDKETAIALGLSVNLFDHLGFGFNRKLVQVDIDAGDHAEANDIGMSAYHHFTAPDLLVNLSYCVSNRGDDLLLNSDPLPRTIRAGAGFQLRSDWSFSGERVAIQGVLERSELDLPGGQTVWHWGCEAGIPQAVIRLGYIDDPDGHITAPTFGIGVGVWVLDRLRVQADWASVPQAEELDRVHRADISFEFLL